MTSVELKARAKINLSIDVLAKRPDGYHDVRMIMQSVALYDKIFIEAANEGISIDCNSRNIPSNSDNIAYKAASLLIDTYKINSGVRIKIEKNIPVSAGLAGGSTDAAAVMNGMNWLFSLGLSDEVLMSLGKKIGADVPYCIKGGTMLAEGIGEILTQLSPLPGVNIVLVKPKISVSTPWVYKNLDLEKINSKPDTDFLIKAIKEKRIDVLSKNMKNVLETVTSQKYSIIQEIEDRLVELGALGSMMSGSGPTVFGVFPDKPTAENAYREIKSELWDSFLTETM